MPEPMRQTAPFPDDLADLVRRVRYRPGWTVRLGDQARDHVDPTSDASDELAGGLTLSITTQGYDTYHVDRGETYRVRHQFIVPAATYTRQSWQRWLFDRFLDVERHEAMEFFTVANFGTDVRPYAPNHGPGHDPYTVRELADDIERRTSFQGKVNP